MAVGKGDHSSRPSSFNLALPRNPRREAFSREPVWEIFHIPNGRPLIMVGSVFVKVKKTKVRPPQDGLSKE